MRVAPVTAFHGQPGYVASWRRLDQSRRVATIKIGGSPFTTFVEAEEACNMRLKNLIGKTEWRSLLLERIGDWNIPVLPPVPATPADASTRSKQQSCRPQPSAREVRARAFS